MKWVSLLKDKVGFSHLSSSSSSREPVQSPSNVATKPRDKHELELDFKRFWEEFRSSNSEKEKEEALNMAIEVFCKLVKQHGNPAQLITKLVDVHLFSFVVGRALVADIEKLKNLNQSGSLDVAEVLKFFTEVLKDGINPGTNLLYALESLVSPPLDTQPLLDSGIFCCLIHILHVLLTPASSAAQDLALKAESIVSPNGADNEDKRQVHRLEVEGSIVHIMKALASHPGAAQSLIEDDSFQLLFQMVATGPINVRTGLKFAPLPLHIIQLRRHAMQILGLLLVNDNGSTAKYIRARHLVKVLLMAVKDFNTEIGDAAYTMGVVDLLLECVELSYRSEAGGVRLRDDIQNAHGYHFLVQFALILSSSSQNQIGEPAPLDSGSQKHISSAGSHVMHGRMRIQDTSARGDFMQPSLLPSLSRLLDVLANLAQTGPQEISGPVGGRTSKASNSKASGHSSRPFTFAEGGASEDMKEKKVNGKVKDLEAVQVLQDIFLKADDIVLQLEVLDRMLRIFASHLENYKLCQQLRTLPLFILNMATFPQILQEKILKILEYAVTVVNCVPEQELLSLCCLLQQPIATPLKHSILSFFVKLLSFDQQYKKVLREVGVLEVLLDDMKQHKYISSIDQQIKSPSLGRDKSSSNSGKNEDDKDAILSSPRVVRSESVKISVFEDEGTIAVAWDCLVSLVKKAEGNQTAFRKSNGFTLILPLLISSTHRSGVLRLLSCLLLEDTGQAHPEELGMLIEVLKSGMVTSISGTQYKLQNDAKCDILWALWRILGSNVSARMVFGEATGFALLLTILHSFQSEAEPTEEQSPRASRMKVFDALLHVVTVAVSDNVVNRLRLHTIISSQTFYDLLCESGLLCLDYEKHVVQLMLELALEIVLPPSWINAPTDEKLSISQCIETAGLDENGQIGFLFLSSSDSSNAIKADKERVFNAGAIGALIRSLIHFTPKLQLEVLKIVEKLARAGPSNQDNLTSVGCVGLLLEIIRPCLDSSSSLLLHALRIVEVLGAYRLSSAELRTLVRYILQSKQSSSGQRFIEMMERLILIEGMTSENLSLAPFVELNMSKAGHACLQISLGERNWPPAAGYSFVCWFQYHNLVKRQEGEQETALKTNPLKRRGSVSSMQCSRGHVLRIFSVGAMEEKNVLCAELYLNDDGVLTLATSASSYLSFPDLQLEEGIWHHLAIVHSKPNALAGLFQSSVAYLYVNGRLRQTGKLGYSPSPIGKSLQVTIGTPFSSAEVSPLSWRLGSCYLFEEVLSSSAICFMYILGRGYRGLFQDTDLLRFVPNEACGGGSLAILDALEAELFANSSAQRVDSASKMGINKAEGSGVVWDLERLGNFSLQLSGKKLIFAFDGSYSDASRTSGTLSMFNLVDPMSAAASPIGGIPRFARLHGDACICTPCSIGDSIRAVGGVAAILALVEAAESREMLHMALSLLVCALNWNPQNVCDMQACRGYHLLALFLHRRMSLFDMQNLELFFQIAACEASLPVTEKPQETRNTSANAGSIIETGYENIAIAKFPDDVSPLGSQADMEDFLVQQDSLSRMSELENVELQAEALNCIVLSNPDMMEHVLLDWTLWVTAPVSIQLALLSFLERLVSMHPYRNHNLTVLRRVNLVQHLLVTLQRGDVEVPVLEKLVVLLGIILEDGFLPSELEYVVKFVIMTFDPPEISLRRRVIRESMGKHVIVRNMLLEMLIDLQMTISSEEFLEQWHKIVSSKLITYLLDEAVHPTSMRWVTTLLGVCLASSPTFATKFRSSSGYQGLSRVLRSFYDSPEIYYILFCLIFGKPVYPRLPEVRMLDFHALIPSDGGCGELKFVDLLESIIAMAKATFDKLSLHSFLAQQTGDFSVFNTSIAAELVEGSKDMTDELQGEALMHKTYAARLMSGEAAAPAVATSMLRFMVDLAKMCRPFSAACRRLEFLESYVDLYFSCARAACAVQLAKGLSVPTADQQNMNDSDDAHSSQHTFSSLPQEQEQSGKTSISIGSFAQGQKSTSSEDVTSMPNYLPNMNGIDNSPLKSGKSFMEENNHNANVFYAESLEQAVTSGAVSPDLPAKMSQEIPCHTLPHSTAPIDSLSLASGLVPGSPVSSEKSSFKLGNPLSMSPVVALTSWLGSSVHSEGYLLPGGTPSLATPSTSISDIDASQEFRSSLQGTAANIFYNITSDLLLQMDSAGSGGGPCSAGAGAVLDFIAEILADIVTEQVKATQIVEAVLETVPLYVGVDSVLVFQGLCLSRLMNFLERLILRDDEETEKKLDKNRWSSNLDTLSWLIVDRIYMGAFPEPGGALKALEFLLSMLQLANKDGHVEEAVPAGKGLLSLTRGSKQVEVYIQTLLKNTNRMIMYCFLPSFLSAIGEGDFLSHVSLHLELKRNAVGSSSADSSAIDTCTVLQLLIAHKRLIFCPSNSDTDLICCLCVNLISLFWDKRQSAQNMAAEIFRYLLLNRHAALEELLVSKPNQGQPLDVLHGGFDKLLDNNLRAFHQWLHTSKQSICKALEQCAAIMWMQYVAGAAKFPGVRMKGMEARRKREMMRRSRESTKIDSRHWEQMSERRYALDLVREAMSTELRVVRQDKYGWVLHAESEWQGHIQQLVHERGIWPMRKSSLNPEHEWQLCPTEGPYRMRKKLERCKVKVDTIGNVLQDFQASEDKRSSTERNGFGLDMSDPDYDSFFHLLSVGGANQKRQSYTSREYEECFYEEAEEFKDGDSASAAVGWNDDQHSSTNDASLHSALEAGGKSSVMSIQMTAGVPAMSETDSPRQSLSQKIDDARNVDDQSEREVYDNGEYLIRPYLEPYEKIRFRYNCERVVGLDKHDGIFLIGELCLYVIENFYIDESGRISEKACEAELSVIDQALGVKSSNTVSSDIHFKALASWEVTAKAWAGGRAWAYNGGAWGKEKVCASGNLPHPWRMWKLESVHELLKREYQLRPVAIELFSMDGCNDLLVFHKKERDEVFKNLVGLNLPRNSMLDTTISGSSKQDSNEGSRLFKIMAKSFCKRWQNGEISNFQYLMHLNTLAGRGYNDLTQYPVFPWVLADYESRTLDLTSANTFRKLDKPIGCQTTEGEEEFKKRYESWDDPDVPKFHYGSHYSSAGIVLFYLIRLPPFSVENQKLQGGQFDHADRLFNSVRDTWFSAAGKGNTSDVKELIPEFFYMPEFLENRFHLDLGVKQSGDKVDNVLLPPWAKGSAREFIRKHREALESEYVSEHLHHWIDLIFGYRQRGKAAEEATNVFYHYTYEGSVDIDAVSDPAMKASILAQINHFGQTPRQLFFKPHVKRRCHQKLPVHALRHSNLLVAQEVRNTSSSISQIVIFHDKILVAGLNCLLKPRSYSKYIAWGFPDRSLRIILYDQEKLISTHEGLHGGSQVHCAGISRDGRILVTGGDDGMVSVWRLRKDGVRWQRRLHLQRALCAHTKKVTCIYVCQPYSLIVSGSEDCSVILWDLSSLEFVRQLPELPAPASAIYANDMTGEVVTAAGTMLAVWSINGDCLAAVNTSQLPSDFTISVTSSNFSDWMETNWYVTGHQSGAVKVWHMVHVSEEEASVRRQCHGATSTSVSSDATVRSRLSNLPGGPGIEITAPEYQLVLLKVLKSHKHPVTALHLSTDLKQLLSGDASGHLLSWTLPDENSKNPVVQESQVVLPDKSVR